MEKVSHVLIIFFLSNKYSLLSLMFLLIYIPTLKIKAVFRLKNNYLRYKVFYVI